MNGRLLSLVLIGISVAYLIVGCNVGPEQQPDKNNSSQVKKTPQDPVDDENNGKGWQGISIEGEGPRRVDENKSGEHNDGSQIVPDGYLNEEKSLQWLSENGYQVNPKSDVPVKKEVPGYSYGPIMPVPVTGTARQRLREGVTMLYQNGKIYISDKDH